MVAKSYQKLKMLSDEPYAKANGKLYVKVLMKGGSEREVRWYNTEEYAKMYPGESVEPEMFVNQKNILGFQEGYITIFKGNQEEYEDWFGRSIARYCRHWGWYIISEDTIPFDLPAGLEPVELKWEMVGENEGMLKSDAEVKSAVEFILYDRSNSTFQGMVGARLELELEVISAHKKDGYYGEQTIHYMVDSIGNQYLWSTTSKSWEVGDKRHIKGTVKDHKVIRNVETTVLTRCTLVK